MRVLVIPEDFRKDQYILKPILSRLFKRIGASSVRVEVCQDPLLGGIDEALKIERMKEIVAQHAGMTDLFILCVDRDGKVGRRQTLNHIEKKLGHNFLAENAWEELETWALAGLKLPKAWRWKDIRAEIDVKERYFNLYATQRGLSSLPVGGRVVLGEEASRHIDAIRQKCPDDFDFLAKRIQAFV